MKRPLKVILLVHPEMRPDRSRPKGATEVDVWRALKRLGYAVEILPMLSDLMALERAVAVIKPHAVFNLLEEFRHEGVYDFHAVSFLEALGIPCTGCNPRGLIVSRNKSWAVGIAQSVGVGAPEIYAGRARPRFPAFVKYVREHASRGLTERNRVANTAQLQKIKRKMSGQFPGEISVQEFIAGEDVTVSMFGNRQPTALQPWRLSLGGENLFATEQIKFSAGARRRRGIRAYRYARTGASELQSIATRLYKSFDLSGYARLDFRVTSEGRAYFIDVNANPNLARDEDFAGAARDAGISYEELIERILRLARKYRPTI